MWDEATWIGEIDQSQLVDGWARLAGGERFGQARLLVWNDDRPRGSVDVPVDNGFIDLGLVRRGLRDLPDPIPFSFTGTRPPISIVICTRDRPQHLPHVLDSLYGLDYPDFEVLIVDNNPASGLTRPVVESYEGLPIRVVDAVGQGLSVARNVGLRNARHGIVAFTDDDAVIDRRWLTNIANGFARDERVACVCGMVPTSELVTPAQSYFDRRAGWAQRWIPAVYDLETHTGGGLFPLQVSEFGTGANFAVRRDVVTALGGFDEALGAGAPSGSGEDVDMFLRVMLAGHLLVREPSAVVWHSHRRTVDDLRQQMHNYAIGLSSWLVKLLTNPRTAVMVATRLVTGARHFGQITVVDDDAALEAAPDLKDLKRHEFTGLLRGPWALLRGRLAGRTATPLRRRGILRFTDFRHGRMWGEPAPAQAPGRLAVLASVAAIAGLLGLLDGLPSGLHALLIGAFVLLGPGGLTMSFFARLPGYAVRALVPTTGLAVCVLVVTGLLMAGVYSPGAVLAGLALTTLVGGVVRWRYLTTHEPATS